MEQEAQEDQQSKRKVILLTGPPSFFARRFIAVHLNDIFQGSSFSCEEHVIKSKKVRDDQFGGFTDWVEEAIDMNDVKETLTQLRQRRSPTESSHVIIIDFRLFSHIASLSNLVDGVIIFLANEKNMLQNMASNRSNVREQNLGLRVWFQRTREYLQNERQMCSNKIIVIDDYGMKTFLERWDISPSDKLEFFKDLLLNERVDQRFSIPFSEISTYFPKELHQIDANTLDKERQQVKRNLKFTMEPIFDEVNNFFFGSTF